MTRATQFIFTMFITGVFASVPSCTLPSTEAPPASSSSAAPSAPLRKQTPRIAVHELEKQIHERVNKVRLKRGLPTRRWDNALGSIAGRHSKDMSVKQYFSHTSPDGHDQSYRYMKSGYAYDHQPAFRDSLVQSHNVHLAEGDVKTVRTFRRIDEGL